MNYYEHHIGDYAEATGHLTFVEDAAYSRCIRKYYATEKPLPADIHAVQRLIGARSKEERAAVEVVLGEFFVLRADGWHNDRCDEEIAAFKAGEPEREAKRANEDNRLRRHREERATLFKRLTDAGQHAPWNIGIKELRELVERVTGTPTDTPATAPVTQPATAPATPATATHTPDTNHQTPVEEQKLPPTAAQAAVDPAKEMIDGAVRYMAECGVGEKQARSMIGFVRKLCADDLACAQILATMQQQRIADPAAWLRKAAESRKGASNAPATHRESAAERVARKNAEAAARGGTWGDGSLDGSSHAD